MPGCHLGAAAEGVAPCSNDEVCTSPKPCLAAGVGATVPIRHNGATRWSPDPIDAVGPWRNCRSSAEGLASQI
jgi:hypothetical protein